jgi:hypothetical protein
MHAGKSLPMTVALSLAVLVVGAAGGVFPRFLQMLLQRGSQFLRACPLYHFRQTFFHELSIAVIGVAKLNLKEFPKRLNFSKHGRSPF